MPAEEEGCNYTRDGNGEVLQQVIVETERDSELTTRERGADSVNEDRHHVRDRKSEPGGRQQSVIAYLHLVTERGRSP